MRIRAPVFFLVLWLLFMALWLVSLAHSQTTTLAGGKPPGGGGGGCNGVIDLSAGCVLPMFGGL
jgi:hypothetical protein